MRIWYYRLGKDHEIIPVEEMNPKDLHEIWDYENRRVGSTQVGPYRVSTVFLVIDHGYGGGRPVLFETMVFGDDTVASEEFEHLEQRYRTWDEAMAGHKAVVEHVEQALLVYQQAMGILQERTIDSG